MDVLGIDTGNIKTGAVEVSVNAGSTAPSISWAADERNELIVERIANSNATVAIIEILLPQGNVVGHETFTTIYWTGRFWEMCEAKGMTVIGISRLSQYQILLGKGAGNDAKIGRAVKDMYGGPKEARGTKKSPGPMYEVTGDCIQALGQAICGIKILKGGSSMDKYRWDMLYTETAKYHDNKAHKKEARKKAVLKKQSKGNPKLANFLK